MGGRHIDIRLTGRYVFVYYYKRIGIGDKRVLAGGCTNQRLLSKRTGLSEGLLMRVFTREGYCYYEDNDLVILKLRTSDIEKGRQSIVRRGNGGMEKFVSRYIIRDEIF